MIIPHRPEGLQHRAICCTKACSAWVLMRMPYISNRHRRKNGTNYRVKTDMKMRHIAMAVAVALSSSYAMADTSSAVRGKISNPEGAPAAGTKVIILHVPSGTSRTVTTNESGSFVASGLRVGGPDRKSVV